MGLEEKTKEPPFKVKSLERNENGTIDMITESEGKLQGFTLYTFSKKVGRALPSFVRSYR